MALKARCFKLISIFFFILLDSLIIAEKRKTIHIHTKRDSYSSLNEFIITKDVKTRNEEITRKVREATKNEFIRRNSRSVDSSMVTVVSLNDSHPQLIVHWAGLGSNVTVSLARDIVSSPNSTSELFFSYNYGKSFESKKSLLAINSTTNAIIQQFYSSPIYNTHYLFADIVHNYLFITMDSGFSFLKFNIPFRPDSITFHSTNANILLGTQKDDPTKSLWCSENFGETWRTIQVNVKSFFWGVPPYDREMDLYVERQEPGHSSNILKSNDLFHNEWYLDNIISGVEDFELHEQYMFATKKQPRVGLSTSLELWISYNRGSFQKAFFPKNLIEKDYYIVDATEDQVFVCVNHGISFSHLYISDVRGTKFSLSLENIVYFNPNNFGSDSLHSHIEEDTFIDLHKVEGLRGIYIASQMNPGFPMSTENSLSVITFDKGGEWSYLTPPIHDSIGNRFPCNANNCSLHLAKQFNQLVPRNRNFPILSKKSAIGLIMAAGMINVSMKSRETDVFLSVNGGVTWKEVLKGHYLFNFGDHGGLIVAAYKNGLTNELLYSWDEGESWDRVQFSKEKIRIYGLMTEPGEKTTVFTLFGSPPDHHYWKIIQVDLISIFQGKNCLDEDYKQWFPSDDKKSFCLLGRRTVYERRIAHAKCYNGRDYERELSTENCTCTREDFECDYGFQEVASDLNNHTCIADSSTKVLSTSQQCSEFHFYQLISKGYRKVSGDTCVGGDEDLYAPLQIPCPIEERPEFILFSERFSVKRMDLASGKIEVFPLGSIENVIAVDFSYRENCLYWSDVSQHKIKRLCLNGNTSVEVLVETNLTSVEGIALDWLNNNLYWTEVGQSASIQVIRTDVQQKGRFRRTIVSSNNVGKPRAIALHPSEGLMFWTDWNDTNPGVMRSHLDGSNIKRIITDVHWPNGLGIDFSRRRIYYTDAMKDFIASAKFDGSDIIILVSGSDVIPHPYAVGIYKDWIYWSDWNRHAILMANKYDGRGINTVINDLMNIMDMKIMHNSIQTGIGPCLKNSCNFLCVSKPGNTSACLCPDGYVIQKSQDNVNESCSCYNGEIMDSSTGLCSTSSSSSCNIDQFKCKNNMCIPKLWVCDHDNDCGDGSDEQKCSHSSCSSSQFACSDGRCIPLHWQCDHDNDCNDHSDETNCKNTTCPPNQFLCANGRCIQERWKCDYDDDCLDESDEKNCDYNTPTPISCNSSLFKCANDVCLPTVLHCDHNDDCGDGSDEVNCGYLTCLQYQFQCQNKKCIFPSWQCDNQDDCGDNSDELNCTSSTTELPATTTPGNCALWNFLCGNKMCIPWWWKCDGVNDCGDNSDELDCQTPKRSNVTCSVNQFVCDNGVCISQNQKCDGDYDCFDGGDERWCTTEAPNTPSPPQCGKYQFECGPTASTHCIWQSWVCDGEVDCDNGTDEANCPAQTCNSDEFRCMLIGGCIPMSLVCNNKTECSDLSDEWGCPSLKDVCAPDSFMCKSGLPRCIVNNKRCDINRDCEDNSDELDCSDSEGDYVTELSVDPASVTSRNFTLHWKPVVLTYGSGITYIPFIMFLNNSLKNFTTKESHFTFTHLNPFNLYVVGVHVSKVMNGKTVFIQAIKRISARTACENPSPPLNVTVKIINSTNNNALVEWLPPRQPNGIITRYTVYTDPFLPSNSEPVLAPVTKKTLINLDFHANYTIWVTAWSSDGPNQPQYQSNESLRVHIMLKNVITRSPENLTINCTKTSAQLTWQKPAVNVDIDGYQIQYSIYELDFTNDTQEKKITIEGLSPGTEYGFEVTAYNKFSRSNPAAILCKTNGVPLKPPENVKAILINPSTIKIQWDPPKDNRSHWIYEVQYGVSDYTLKDAANTNRNFILIPELQSCRHYIFRIRIVGPLGISKFYDKPVDEWTPYNKLGRPKELTATDGSQFDTVKISWSAPCEKLPAGESLSYEITTKDLRHDFKADVKQWGPFSNITMTVELKILPSTVYSIKVNVVGSPNFIEVIYNAQTYPAPINLQVIQYINGSLGITWSRPPDYDKVKNLNLSYAIWITNMNSTWTQPSQITQLHRILINDIQPEIYYIKVCFVDGKNFYGFNSSVYDFRALKYSAAVGLSTSSFIGIMVSVVICIIVLFALLVLFVLRHRRLQRSFLSFANSHYDTRSGATTFSTGDDLGEDEDSPMIRGFSDDEPLVVA